MASKRNFRRKSCSRKKRHACRLDAWKSARVYLERGEDLKPYKCRFCGFWHLGHRMKRKEE